MISFSLQLLGVVILMSYAALWRRRQQKRRAKSWNEIIAQLSDNDWGFEDIAEGYLYKSGIRATTEDIWQRIAGCRGLWAMYKNAAVLLQLADYAAEHGEGVEETLLENLRREAFEIRLSVMLALAHHAMSASSAAASVNAHRAAAVYSEMLATLTAFMQEHSALLFPSYLDAVA